MNAPLFDRWMALRAEKPRLHALDLATELGVSEVEMLASACGDATSATSAERPIAATRLQADWPAFIAELPKLGRVKTVTRNADAVIEVEGSYGNVEFFGPAMGQSVSSVDLRIFPTRWKHGFAVREQTSRGESNGIQFFDGSGVAIHKLYLREASNREAFAALVAVHTAEDQSPRAEVSPAATMPPPRPDAEVDAVALRTEWRAMTDTHQFFGLLRKHDVARTQALRLAGDGLAQRAKDGALASLLHDVAGTDLPIMVFVGNAGLIQIHSGAIHKVVSMGPWINVLDPGFDLHVRTDRVAESWVVRKPTTRGVVTSLELYDARGEQIAHVVGKRKDDSPENPSWRAAVESLRAV